MLCVQNLLIHSSVVKRPSTSVPSRYKKNVNITVPGFFKCYRVPGQPGSWRVQPYDFHNAENADGISESSYKNGIYSLTRNVTEFVKV